VVDSAVDFPADSPVDSAVDFPADSAVDSAPDESVLRPAAQPVAARPLTDPHPARLAVDHPHRAGILAAHAAALQAAAAGYADPQTGLFVLTAGYLTGRGHCCGNGCRHCPYLE